MRITTLIAATAIAAAATTSAFAGGFEATEQTAIIQQPQLIEMAPAGSSAGSMGSLGGGLVLPALAGLLVIGALAASSSDSGSGS